MGRRAKASCQSKNYIVKKRSTETLLDFCFALSGKRLFTLPCPSANISISLICPPKSGLSIFVFKQIDKCLRYLWQKSNRDSVVEDLTSKRPISIFEVVKVYCELNVEGSLQNIVIMIGK